MIKPPIPDNEKDRLKALRDLEILDTKEERVFDGLTSLAAYICKAPMAMISLIDSDRQWFKSRYNLSETETSRDVSFCAHAILHDGIFTVPDATRDDRFRGNPLVTGDLRLRFYAGSPVTTHDGYKVGTVCVVDHVRRRLSDGQRAALTELSYQVGSQLELRRKIRELEKNSASK